MKLDGTDPRQAGDRRGRMATSAAFFVQGLCFAVVVTRVSVLQSKFHLSNGQLTLVLLIVPVIAGVGSVLSGPLAARLGSGTVLRVAQPLVCLSLPAIGFASTRPVSNYSSVYMSKVQHGSKAVLPLAFAAYQTMMVAGRAVGDHTVRRFGATAVVRAGAVVAGLGLLGVVLAPSPYLAIVAFAVTGLGFCVVPPMCFSATSKLDPTGSGIAISRVNVFNYAGFVLGAALVGGIAGGVGGSAGWRAAYAAPLVLTLVIIALAAGFEPGRTRGTRSEVAAEVADETTRDSRR